MYKGFKISILILVVVSMCTYVTYSIEPEDPPSQTATPPAVGQTIQSEPTATPEPSGVPSPTPEAGPSPSPSPTAVPEQVPSPQPEEPALEEPNEAQLKAVVDFNNEVDTIVMKRINAFFKNGGKGTVGIYIRELSTGFEYAYNADKTNPNDPQEGYFNTASTCKLLSAAVMYRLNECGELELDKEYKDPITKRQYNLKKLLPRMISHSVNDYFNITLRHLGAAKINENLLKLGTEHSVVYSEIMPAEYSSVQNNIKRYGISRSPRTTPRDLGHVLRLLYEGGTFGEENNKLFTQALLDNIYSNRLPAGLGYRSPVAHKTGTSSGEGVYNDAGIVFLEGNPYIMVVMSKGSSSGVQSLLRSITGDVYGYMKKRTELQSSLTPDPLASFSSFANLV